MNNYELKNMKYKVKLLESLNLDATSIFGTRVHNTVISLLSSNIVTLFEMMILPGITYWPTSWSRA